MTERLFYEDSYLKRFSANVVERLTVQDKPAVILDRTAFYATSGGQPHDTGSMNGVAVLDVSPREDDGAVVHWLDAEIADEQVEGEIDWARRFDHMQHHTGQHILTQAFVQVANAKTVAFHLSADSVTIDLDTTSLTDEISAKTEDLANQIIYENRAVTAKLRAMDDQEGVRIRRLPKHLATDGLRVIEIDGFDTTACGGTHVAHTGEIGIIKVLKLEKRGNKTRVEFRCGWRALQDYREKNAVITRLAANLNSHFSETVQAVERLQQDYKDTLAALKAARGELVEYEAARLIAAAARQNDITIISLAFENRDAAEVKALATRLAETSKTAALLGVPGEKAQFFFGRSGDLDFNMGQLLKETLAQYGGRGGGQPNFAQGGGFEATLEQAQQVLEAAKQRLGK